MLYIYKYFKNTYYLCKKCVGDDKKTILSKQVTLVEPNFSNPPPLLPE